MISQIRHHRIAPISRYVSLKLCRKHNPIASSPRCVTITLCESCTISHWHYVVKIIALSITLHLSQIVSGPCCLAVIITLCHSRTIFPSNCPSVTLRRRHIVLSSHCIITYTAPIKWLPLGKPSSKRSLNICISLQPWMYYYSRVYFFTQMIYLYYFFFVYYYDLVNKQIFLNFNVVMVLYF
jgi:hypothetical protein